GDPVVHICSEVKDLAAYVAIDPELDCDERRVFDDDSTLLHWGDQKIFVALAFEDRREQLDQSRPADRRFEIEPSAVSADAHVEIAAIGRIPEVNRRQATAIGVAGRAGNDFQTGSGLLNLLRHRRPIYVSWRKFYPFYRRRGSARVGRYRTERSPPHSALRRPGSRSSRFGGNPCG